MYMYTVKREILKHILFAKKTPMFLSAKKSMILTYNSKSTIINLANYF